MTWQVQTIINMENLRKQINSVFGLIQTAVNQTSGGQTEVDFGATPVESASFTITDANVTASSHILAQQAYVAPTGKDLDELEMDVLACQCAPGNGQFTLFIRSVDGSYLADKFKINYALG